MSFFFAVGCDFFGEIAKLRAARVLWADLARSLGARSTRAMQLRMHCQTAGSSLHAQHAHNNIVRTTLEALAAVLGGTQSLHTNAWDEALSLPGEAAATVARDTQRILQHEMGLCDTVDPLGGAYMIEALTARTIEAVTAMLGEIDVQGGVIGAIRSGWAQSQLHRAATRIQARIDAGEQVIVGVSRDHAAPPTESDWLDVDARMVRAVQVDRLRQLRANRNAARTRAALHALTHCARSGTGNLLAMTIEAMRARATVGECTAALEHVWPRWHMALESGAQVYSTSRGSDAAWNAARHAVANWTEMQGRPPRLALAKLGQDGHDRGVRVVAAGLTDAGFDVRMGPLFATPQEAAAWACACEPDVIGVSTLAGAHGTLVPKLADALRAHRCRAPLVLGGIVPEAHREALLACGVAKIFGPDTSLERIVVDVLRVLSEATLSSPC